MGGRYRRPRREDVVLRYQVNIGPDGKPHVKEFGNVKPRGGHWKLGVREPLVDVSVDEKEGTVKVVAEMPGADKSSINVSATEENVTITANNSGKPYNAEVPLGVGVDRHRRSRQLHNGTLQVSSEEGSRASEGVNVQVNRDGSFNDFEEE